MIVVFSGLYLLSLSFLLASDFNAPKFLGSDLMVFPYAIT